MSEKPTKSPTNIYIPLYKMDFTHFIVLKEEFEKCNDEKILNSPLGIKLANLINATYGNYHLIKKITTAPVQDTRAVG